MKEKNSIITHESFPQFVERLEKESVKLNGRKISRGIASWFNMLLSSGLALLALAIFYGSIEPEKISAKEAFSHIPEIFLNAGKWALGLFPKDTNMWVCMIILLLAIPVSGVVTGLIFRFIPFKGKAFKLEDAETETERADNAITLVDKLKSSYNAATDFITTAMHVTIVLACLAVIAIPVISACRASSGSEWYMIVGIVLINLIQMIFLLLAVLCVMGFAVFFLSLAQEWVTSLFYTGNNYKKEKAQLEEFRKFLDDEAVENHKALIRKTEDEAVDLLIAGKIAAALKTIATVEEEAEDTYYINSISDLFAKEPKTYDLIWCLECDEERIKSSKLRAFLGVKREECREKLLQIAKEEYPKAVELYEKGEFEEARDLLKSSLAIDYRDGVAYYALADFRANCSKTYTWIIEKLNYAVEKGLESENLEVECLKTIKQVKDRRQWEKERREREEREKREAEEAYWLEIGRQSLSTCEHLVNGYCCRYCTLDNFPHKCYYLDNPNDMWLCSDRK
ncbi:MAG: hypothetical protein IKJ50_03035 [Clostridia bacterium]|nr:hypothetical protein [Clostridia bacterium]